MNELENSQLENSQLEISELEFSELKSILSNSSPVKNSDELDQRILSAAQAQAEKNNIDNRQINPSWFNSVGSITAVAASIVLTLAIFIGLNSAISPDNQTQQRASNGSHSGANQGFWINLGAGKLASSDGGNKASRPSAQQLEQPAVPEFSAAERDQRLLKLEIPNTQQLLATYDYASPNNRLDAERAITIAMGDIRSMLERGQVGGARLRYGELVRSCTVCTLPSSLEDLVLIQVPNTSPSFESG